MNSAGDAPGTTLPNLSTSSTSALPQLSQEWTTSRDLIAKLDERIHDTRKLVFGLFSALLTAGSLLGLRDSSLGQPSGAKIPWLAVHLALLGLLLTGRFIERQALQLQAAVASRAWVIEMLTPVELTSTLSYFGQEIVRETKLIYLALGGVSAFVTTITVTPPESVGRVLLILGCTLFLFFIVIWCALRLMQGSRWSLDKMRDSWRSTTEKPTLPLYLIIGSAILYFLMLVLVRNAQLDSWAWIKTIVSDQPFLILGSTLVYALIVFCLEPGDLAFARDLKDWSFSTTSCRVNETVSIVLMNHRNKILGVSNPVATLIQVFDVEGKPTQFFDKDQKPIQLFSKKGKESPYQAKESSLRDKDKRIIQVFNKANEPIQDAIFDLVVPNALLVDEQGQAIEIPVDTMTKIFLPKRRSCRWIWTPTKPGLWGLFLQEHPMAEHWFSSRFIFVSAPEAIERHVE